MSDIAASADPWTVSEEKAEYLLKDPDPCRLQPKRPPVVFAYLRVSTDVQHVENQLPDVVSYCERNKKQLGGLVLRPENVIREPAKSGYKLGWKERKLGKLVKRSVVDDHVVFWDVSRLGREPTDTVAFVRKCTKKKLGITLHFVKLGLLLPPVTSQIYRDNMEIAGRSMLMLMIWAGMAGVERDDFRARSRNGIKRRIAAGLPFGGRRAKPESGNELWERRAGIWKGTQHYDSKIFDPHRDAIVQMLRDGYSRLKVSKELGFKASSLYDYVRNHRLLEEAGRPEPEHNRRPHKKREKGLRPPDPPEVEIV